MGASNNEFQSDKYPGLKFDPFDRGVSSRISYKNGYKCQLADYDRLFYLPWLKDALKTDYVHRYFILTTTGWLVVLRGYAWDGATGAKDTKTILRGTVMHDAIYQLIGLGVLDKVKHRRLADLELIKMCKEDGMNPRRLWRIKTALWFNRTYLAKGWTGKKSVHPVLTAP